MLTFEFDKFDKRGLKEITDKLNKDGLPVATVEGSNKPTREAGYQIKSATVTFESGQVLVLKAKVNSPTFYQAKLNGKVLAIRDYKQLDNEMKEIADYVKGNEPNYLKQKEKALARQKVAVPKVKPVNTTVAEQTDAFKATLEELTAQNEALSNQVVEVGAAQAAKGSTLDGLNQQIRAEEARGETLKAELDALKNGAVLESAEQGYKILSNQSGAWKVIATTQGSNPQNAISRTVGKNVKETGKDKDGKPLFSYPGNKVEFKAVLESGNDVLAKGDTVRVSDGTPEPPARFKSQHGTWALKNYTGTVYDIDDYGIQVRPEGSTRLVRTHSYRSNLTISKVQGGILESAIIAGTCPECNYAGNMECDDGGETKCPECGAECGETEDDGEMVMESAPAASCPWCGTDNKPGYDKCRICDRSRKDADADMAGFLAGLRIMGKRAMSPDMQSAGVMESAIFEASALPGLTKWMVAAGGTSAASGKYSYHTVTGDTGWHINPMTNDSGRHIGYQVTVWRLPGRNAWSWIDRDGNAAGYPLRGGLFSSPQEAVKACQKAAEKADMAAEPKQMVAESAQKRRGVILETAKGKKWKYPLEFVIDIDERGSFAAHVEDAAGKIVAEWSEDDCQESGGFPPVEDGFMRNTRDMAGLAEYLGVDSIKYVG